MKPQEAIGSLLDFINTGRPTKITVSELLTIMDKGTSVYITDELEGKDACQFAGTVLELLELYENPNYGDVFAATILSLDLTLEEGIPWLLIHTDERKKP